MSSLQINAVACDVMLYTFQSHVNSVDEAYFEWLRENPTVFIIGLSTEALPNGNVLIQIIYRIGE